MKKQVVYFVLSLCLFFCSAFKVATTQVLELFEQDSSKIAEDKGVAIKKVGKVTLIDSSNIKIKILEDKMDVRSSKTEKYIDRIDIMKSKLDKAENNMIEVKEERRKDSAKIADLEKQVSYMKTNMNKLHPELTSDMFYTGQFKSDSTGQNVTVTLHKNDASPSLPKVEIPVKKRSLFQKIFHK